MSFTFHKILRNYSNYPVGFYFWGLVALVLGAFILSPVIALVSSLFSTYSQAAQESLSYIREYLLGSVIKDSLILTVGTLMGTLLLGVPAAWVCSRNQFKYKSLVSALLVLPLAIPPYILGFLVTDIKESLVPLLLSIRGQFGFDIYLFAEESSRYLILILVFSSVLYPYVFLAARSAFSGNVKSLEEASLSLGHSAVATFFKIYLPLARPAIISSLFLVAMEVMNDYGAVKHFGFNTFTILLFKTWFELDQLMVAQKLASWILIGVLVFLILEKWQRGRAQFIQNRTNEQTHVSHHTHLLKFTQKLNLIIPLTLGLILPIYLLFSWMIQSFGSLETGWLLDLAKAFFNSLLLGVGVTIIILVFALTILGFMRYSKNRYVKLYNHILMVAGYACPGAVMAIGVLALFTFKEQISWLNQINWLTTTVFGLVFALTCRYYSIAAQMLSQALTRLPKSYDLNAQSLGTRISVSYLTINLPLIKPAIFSAIALVFVDITKELPLSLLLRPFNFETIGTYTYSLVDQGQLYHCAFPSAALILLCATGILLVEFGGWRRATRS